VGGSCVFKKKNIGVQYKSVGRRVEGRALRRQVETTTVIARGNVDRKGDGGRGGMWGGCVIVHKGGLGKGVVSRRRRRRG